MRYCKEERTSERSSCGNSHKLELIVKVNVRVGVIYVPIQEPKAGEKVVGS
jgi:hypothetical protein